MAKRSDKTQIDEIAEEAIRRIREAAEKEKSMHAVEQHEGPRRGPKPGTGGRPRKGEGRREQRGISMDPAVVRWLESERQPHETFSEVVERILRRQMPENN